MRINLAAAICWESYMPLLRQSLYAQNINLYLAPTADGRDSWLSLMRTVGVEGRCFVLSSNMCVRDSPPSAEAEVAGSTDGIEIAMPRSPATQHKRRKSIFDEDGNEIVLSCPADDENGTVSKSGAVSPMVETPVKAKTKESFSCRGGSCIVGPFGDVLAGPQWEDDHGIIFADVDFRDCIKGRLDLDAAGSYSRNDSFRFSVDGLDMDPLPY